jgi:hypothetical protein
VIGVLDAVRNKILDASLELEQVAPDLNVLGIEPKESREKVSAVFQTVVQPGGHATIGTDVKQYNVQVTPGDQESLSKWLEGVQGASEADKQELIEAAKAAKDEGPEAVEKNGRLKAALKKFGGFAAKAGQEATNLAIKVAIEKYLGSG